MSLRASLLMLLAFVIARPAIAAPVNESPAGIAVEGHDVVAYHLLGKPALGSPDFTHEWNGATWRFASREHRDLFAASPERYAPQYGGFCAFGMSRGYAVGIDPRAWSIVEGRLYLNYDLRVRERWLEDPAGFIAKANVNWEKLQGEGP